MQNPICFYNDFQFDGVCGAAIVYDYFGGKVELYPITQGNLFPIEKITGRSVILLGYSPHPFNVMLDIEKKAHELIWIDYHLVAIQEAHRLKMNFRGMQEEHSDAGTLTWKYFYPEVDIPIPVNLIGRYATNDYVAGDPVDVFNTYLSFAKHGPEDGGWETFLHDYSLTKLVSNDILKEYVKTQKREQD